MKKSLIAVLAVIAAGGAAAAVFSILNGRDGAGAAAGTAEEARGPRIVVKALGRVEAASEEIDVASDLTGRIGEILVDEGAVVARGDPLVKLEPFVYSSRVEAAKSAVAQAAARTKLLKAGARTEEIDVARSLLEEAKASERLARQNWERVRQLVDAGIISQNDIDLTWKEYEAVQSRVAAAREQLAMTLNRTREEELEAARAELGQREHELAVAHAELEKTVLRAPIAGTIIRKNMKVGEAVSAFQPAPVVTIADLDDLRVRAEVDEIDIARVRLGQEVELEILAEPETVLHGKVVRLGKAMGRKKVESNDPNERADVRVLEVLIDIDEARELPLGLRVIASFLESGSPR